MKRREFIQKSALTTVGSMLIPNFLKAYELEHLITNNNLNGKILVVIQLSGGNDGLNTIIPYQNDLYYQNRPALGIKKENLISLNDELGLNAVMGGLKKIYDQGYLSIINQVGYPNPDRSHFRSMDIWHTASASNQYLSTGWLGRYLDAQCQQNCTSAHMAIEVDDSLSLALKGDKIKGLAMTQPDKLYKNTQDKQIKTLATYPHKHEKDENVAYLYKTLAETVSSAQWIYEKAKITASKATYPENDFAKRLKTIASLIISGLETQVYYVSLGSFDTHTNQKAQQERLLKIYADAVDVFVNDLKNNQKWNQVAIMTFSEFGRRVAQNASGGTDHGTANQVFLMAEKLKKAGFYNPAPNLTDLDEGDLKYSIDFRNIYAALLQQHLQVEPKTVLNQNFEPLALL
ncbi:MAG: DUF1501 domain-containing protein [Cytophagales bacterium]|nr:MAG: DUF1501 domain-containing protein [Cytophagales bacterium]